MYRSIDISKSYPRLFMDLAIVILYVFINICVGLWVSRGRQSSKKWARASYNRWVICMTLSASFIGGGFTIGLAEKTYIYGMAFVVTIWGFSLKEACVAKFLAPRIKKFQKNAITAGDIIEHSFGKNAKTITGIASFCICGGIIGAQLLACGNIINWFFPYLSQIFCTIAIALVVLTYIVAGGLRSVVALDMIHFCIILIMIPTIAIFGYLNIDNAIIVDIEPTKSLSASSMLVLGLSFFLGESLVPPYVQRLLIGKDEKEVQAGTMYSAIISIIFFTFVGIIGVIAYALDPSTPAHLALPYTVQAIMPGGLRGLSIAALIAIVLSSCNSFTNSASLAVYHDVIKNICKGIKRQHELMIMRIITCLIIICATLFAITSKSALDVLLESYKFWTPLVLIPLIMSIFDIRSSGKAFVISAILSILTMILWGHYKPWSSGVDGALEDVIVATMINAISLFTINTFTHNNNIK